MVCKQNKIFVLPMYIKMKGVPFVSFFFQFLDSMPSRRGGEKVLRVNPQPPSWVVENRLREGGLNDNSQSHSQSTEVGQVGSGREVHGENTSREQGAVLSPSVEGSPPAVVERRASSTMVLDSAVAGPSGDGAIPLEEEVYRRILEAVEQYEQHVGGVRQELGALMKTFEELVEQSGE